MFCLILILLFCRSFKRFEQNKRAIKRKPILLYLFFGKIIYVFRPSINLYYDFMDMLKKEQSNKMKKKKKRVMLSGCFIFVYLYS